MDADLILLKPTSSFHLTELYRVSHIADARGPDSGSDREKIRFGCGSGNYFGDVNRYLPKKRPSEYHKTDAES